MSFSQIKRDYKKSMMMSSIGYAVTLLGLTVYIVKAQLSPLMAGILSVIPGAFILLMLRSVWVYLHRVDEAQRFYMTKSMISALFVMLALSGSWGLVEMMSDDLPKLPIFWMFPLFFLVFGLSTCFGQGRGMGLK